MTLEPGLQAAFRHTVTEADTAVVVGSGHVPVLATPRVLALAERATVAAVEGALEAGATTVGARVELDHLAPSPVGAELEVEAVLDGSRAGASSSPSACATGVGRWPAAGSPGWWWTPPPSSATSASRQPGEGAAWRRLLPGADRPAIRAATMPIAIVSQMEMLCRPGSTSRPSAPIWCRHAVARMVGG